MWFLFLLQSIFHWLWSMVARVTSQMTQILLGLSFFLTVAFQVGWVHRFLTWSMERELSIILNHTPVTVGSIRVDLLRGKLWACNLILHAPRREQWKWKSPVQARIGNLYVECNIVLCCLSLWFLREERPLEITTIEISDIQGFVERKQNIFNFYLMDPHLDVPDPVVTEEDDDDEEEEVSLGEARGGGATTTRRRRKGRTKQKSSDTASAAFSTEADVSLPPHPHHNAASTSTNHNINSSNSTTVETTIISDTTTTTGGSAQKLVEDMVRALGRATQQGSLHTALVESRARIKTQLKALQNSSSVSKTEAMQEGVKIVQQVSKSLVEKTQTVPSVVFPTRRELPHEKIVYGRVGRVVIRDLRVFTRDHHFDDDNDDDGDDDNKNNDMISSSGWNKPIWLEKVTMRAAEFCPPLSAKDLDQPHLPAVFQPLDRCFEIVWKRVLAEIAKSNTGAFFQTAMGEVFDYWMEAAPTSTSTTTTPQPHPSSSSLSSSLLVVGGGTTTSATTTSNTMVGGGSSNTAATATATATNSSTSMMVGSGTSQHSIIS